MISDQGIYDWSEINLNAPNRFLDQTETSRITVDQVLFDTGRQSLAAQFGWFREDSERSTRYIMADGATNGPTGQLVLDINERLLDGSANPFFMRPFLQQVDPRPMHAPLRHDTYRGQFAYKVDFTAQHDWRRWLGAHSFVGYTEYKDKVQRTYRFFEAMMGEQPWMFNADGTRSTTSGCARGIEFTSATIKVKTWITRPEIRPTAITRFGGATRIPGFFATNRSRGHRSKQRQRVSLNPEDQWSDTPKQTAAGPGDSDFRRA